MIEVGKENSVHYALNLMNNINKIISNSEKSNNKELANYCCMDYYSSENPYKYLKYFRKQNSNIDTNIKDFNEVNDIIKQLNSKTKYPSLSIIYEPLFKPSQTIYKLNFIVIPEEIKQIYLKYIDNGLYKGKLHIYDRYNRCVLSNEKKADIEAKTYTIQDYKRIEGIINSSNQITIKNKNININNNDSDVVIDMQNIEIIKLNELIDKCPNIEVMKFIKDYLNKIKESIEQIYDSDNGNVNGSISHSGKNKKKEVFDIYRHISIINSQIETEIKELTVKITSIDKNINKYSKIMSNLGNFTKHYEEYKTNLESMNMKDRKNKGENGMNDMNGENNNIDNSNLYRYTKKEEHIQSTIKFLNDVINQIKNGELSNPLNKERIRPQFRDFLQFGENIKLFKKLSVNTRTIYNYGRMFKSKHKYKIFFPEMVSSILQYLNVISLVNLFNELDNDKVNKELGMKIGAKIDSNRENQTGEIIDYRFRVNEEPDEALKDLNQEMNLGLEYKNDYNEYNEDTDEDTQIESIEIKNNNSNLKIIGGFIISYLDKINDIQLTYDELTTTKINLIVNTHEQKLRTANLKSFEWLSQTGNEAQRQIVMLQMHKLKKLKYADLAQYVSKEYGAEFNNLSAFTDNDNEDDNEYVESDNYEGEIENDENDDYKVEYDEDGNEKERKDIDIDNEEMGVVFDIEEDEDGDQDYGNLAVG